MAIFHLSAKVISRGKGQSAIAAAAYRSGERLRDEQADEQKFYKARAERIEFTEIMAPSNAPEWAFDRNQLWNEVERAEKRKDAQLAREIEVSLPHELTDQQREWLIKDFAREQFVRKGYAVDIAIHAPDKASDDRNHHAHLMISMRTLGPDGFSKTKDRSQNSGEQFGQWREQWAHLANRHLERHGHAARIDHRSLKAQGIDREPTVHVGYAATEMAARGAQSDRIDELRGILDRNEIRLDMKSIEAELKALEKTQEEQQRAAAAAQKAVERPHVVIATDHALADAEAKRAAAMQQLAEAARKDSQALRDPQEGGAAVARDYGEGARAQAQEVRQEARAERADAQQTAWRESVEDYRPGQPRPVQRGLQVVDKATGAVSGLGDFVTDLLAGAPPPQEKSANMKAFVTDPMARKTQQLSRMATARAAQEADYALTRIGEDMKAGRNLKAEDIQALTRQHQESIRHFGDSAVQQMVKDAQDRAKDYWKGQERERE